jgi:hypothetical protein
LSLRGQTGSIFSFFETFCEDASRNKLRVSANFMILVATVQKLWVFEVFRWTMGRAGMCWSQWGGVDQSAQKWGKKEEKKGGRKKNGEAGRKKWDPRRAGGQLLVSDFWSPTSGQPTVESWSVVADQSPTAGRPLVGDQRSLIRGPTVGVGQRPAVACRPRACPTTTYGDSNFYFYFILFIWKYEVVGENGCTVYPFFQASPYTWKCQIFHSS